MSSNLHPVFAEILEMHGMPQIGSDPPSLIQASIRAAGVLGGLASAMQFERPRSAATALGAFNDLLAAIEREAARELS